MVTHSIDRATRPPLVERATVAIVVSFLGVLGVALPTQATAAERVGDPRETAETPIQRSARTPPGAEPQSETLAIRLWSAYEALGPDYEPRTEYLREDGRPIYVNRLILEDSPYLRQHAHNPVDWYPWGPEAFAKAERENKPIFLSIGYSTCHWCHVMERESFDSEGVARLMNENFVCIKVDREQRPDVDEVYMTALQVVGVRGGWPMSSFLTSDGKPFFGGTYYPRPTFVELLSKVAQGWQSQRSQLETRAEQISSAVQQATGLSKAPGDSDEHQAVSRKSIAAAIAGVLSRYDPQRGGFSPAPKFPQESSLLFLLDQVLRTEDDGAMAAIEVTLDRMARGGIYDQVGGGFHRYSTDAEWLVPHFEKMLYNQALLGRVYLEAWRLTGDPLHERIARQTLDYVLRDMGSPTGAFYSATDADSEGHEGTFFVWTPKTLRAALPEADAEFAIRLFDVTPDGNFEGRSILHLPKALPKVAVEMEIPLDELFSRLDRVRERLIEVRERREHPLRDDKIITAWNAMMITTLARAGTILGEARYLEAADRAAEFLWTHNHRKDGRLWRANLNGKASVDGTLDDYAYLLEALLSLFDASEAGTSEAADRLDRAEAVADVMISTFWDKAEGGFFVSADDHDGRLLVRPKSAMDGAIPSGNSVALRSLAMLADRTGRFDIEQAARVTLTTFSPQMLRQPSASGYLWLGAAELFDGSAGPLAYGSQGIIRAEAALANGRLTVDLDIADGWHINSDRPLQTELIPTSLTAVGEGLTLDDVRFPPAKTLTLGFQDEPVALFEGSIPIRAKLRVDQELSPRVDPPRVDPPRIGRLKVVVQACDDEKCLAPDEIMLEVPLAGMTTRPRSRSARSILGWTAGALAVAGLGGWLLARQTKPVAEFKTESTTP